ncbi:MAG: SCO family protein, partial [Candidatus Thiodiazotropha sp.]
MSFRFFLLFSLLSLTGTSYGVGGDFTLTADDGSSYSLRDSRGKAVVLTFGYTYCPDVCPMALATISSVLDSLGDDAKRVDALFVSLDP